MDFEEVLLGINEGAEMLCQVFKALGLKRKVWPVVDKVKTIDGDIWDFPRIEVDNGWYTICESINGDMWVVERMESIAGTYYSPPDYYSVTVAADTDMGRVVEKLVNDLINYIMSDVLSTWSMYVDSLKVNYD